MRYNRDMNDPLLVAETHLFCRWPKESLLAQTRAPTSRAIEAWGWRAGDRPMLPAPIASEAEARRFSASVR